MVENKCKIPIWAYVMLAIIAIIMVIGLIYGINHFTTVLWNDFNHKIHFDDKSKIKNQIKSLI